MRNIGTIIGGVIALALLATLAFWGLPQYDVYSKTLKGHANYEQALQDRRIRVLEAQAEKDAASLHADAEVARARGTNAANEIMARSLGGPDNYLRWSYIHMLEATAGKGDRQVIYLPTEAGMPILEASRHSAPIGAGG